jgi:polysaccharide deacetylase family protein (PEP-CTERM system associated)
MTGAAPSRLAAFSTDVEDYYQAEALRRFFPRETWDGLDDRTEANVERILAILAEHRVRGTFFVLGWTAERHPDLVRRIAAEGHEVASHGYDHELIYRQSVEAFRADVRRARALLQDLSGQKVYGYRAPSYTIVHRTRWALAVLAEEGHRYDSSVFPIRRRKYGIPDAPREPYRIDDAGTSGLIEFPLPAVRIGPMNVPATGGAYLRLLPIAFQTWAVRRLLGEGKAVVLNIHPWELDPDQPRLPVGPRTRWTHYHNLDRAEGRLRTLLALAPFRSQGDVLGELGLLT